ncbi:MAG: DUF2605 domain-containing protein [Chloroflexaceae bacterium]|nr:DUF2605 domain-containing protein [Chloroflexaceae bacterium]
MPSSKSNETELLKAVLEPLLDDFLHWFERSRSLLESQQMPFLSESEQSSLIERLKQSQQEVISAKILFKATGGQVGIDTAVLVPWHRLVTECWQVGSRWRTFNQNQRI